MEDVVGVLVEGPAAPQDQEFVHLRGRDRPHQVRCRLGVNAFPQVARLMQEPRVLRHPLVSRQVQFGEQFTQLRLNRSGVAQQQ